MPTINEVKSIKIMLTSEEEINTFQCLLDMCALIYHTEVMHNKEVISSEILSDYCLNSEKFNKIFELTEDLRIQFDSF